MSGPVEAISPLGAWSLTPLSFESRVPDAAVADAAASGTFSSTLTDAVENLQELQSTSNALAVKAVTGDLQDIHQATIAATRASLTLDLVVAVRDRSVAAFNEIMRMQA
ncbi:flagellar hook-basal body complex protein FliE [Microbacterium sp.]|uniref:flagellar hook-basal body complex protein FliE n=1 Tax=Microbacterium sp. TaxID=51671 RepID=UPI002D79B732|nr:flagellar hook-basal body complex protein FliE [Microbacterium sp.]HET6301412.1 flagellar hook-basal body complex protein FliE [Microbacterium sp.]